MNADLGFKSLKEKQRAIRAHFPEALGLRVHRAISWIGRAEQAEDDHDVRFILLWVSFLILVVVHSFLSRSSPHTLRMSAVAIRAGSAQASGRSSMRSSSWTVRSASTIPSGRGFRTR